MFYSLELRVGNGAGAGGRCGISVDLQQWDISMEMEQINHVRAEKKTQILKRENWALFICLLSSILFGIDICVNTSVL